MKPRILLLAALIAPLLTLLTPSPAAASEAHEDQIERLYLTVLGRPAEAEGLDYWTDILTGGTSLEDLTRTFLEFPEVELRSSGDLVIDSYRNALDRQPDPAGYQYWSSVDPVDAVLHISESLEHRQRTGTLPPPPAVAAVRSTDVPSDWVDAGHGVFVPPILLEIRFCESTDNYTAANPWSSARGAYQFLTKSWNYYGHAERYGVAQAHLATPAQQDEAALITWQKSGTRPWAASAHCWN